MGLFDFIGAAVDVVTKPIVRTAKVAAQVTTMDTLCENAHTKVIPGTEADIAKLKKAIDDIDK